MVWIHPLLPSLLTWDMVVATAVAVTPVETLTLQDQASHQAPMIWAANEDPPILLRKLFLLSSRTPLPG